MSLYYPTHQPAIAPGIMVRKRRTLPVDGEIVVRVGARVEPDDVVARASMPGAPQPVEIARALRVPAGQGARTLAKSIGSSLEAGDIVAARRQGLARRVVVKAPLAGTLSGYDARTGHALITPSSMPFELHAGLRGIVTEYIANRGVVIDTPAVLVRGIAGLGGEQHGVLQVAASDATEELVPDQITARLAYAIVLGGGTTTAATLQRAVELKVRAIIVGSIPASELRAFLGYTGGLNGWRLGYAGWDFPPPVGGPDGPPFPPLTVILIEGFGRVPMAAKAWELLAAHDGEEVAVDGTTRLRGGLIRPEILVPLPRAAGVLPFESTAPPLKPRALVRLIAPPYLGQTGRVHAVSPGKQPLESGLSAPAAQVELRDGRQVWVPLVNLEVIE